MAYTAVQYEAQRRVLAQINRANATGICPVCNARPQAHWPSGIKRLTCGEEDCYRKWLRVRPQEDNTQHEPHYPTDQHPG